jgi:DNA-binding beta-propeller fold protein YncE
MMAQAPMQHSPRRARAGWPAILVASSALMLFVALCGIASPARATDGRFGAPQFLGEGFSLPSGIAFDPIRRRVFVALAGSNEIRYASLPDALRGGEWRAMGASVDRRDPTALAQPQGVAVDPAGNVYVADTFHDRARLYRYQGPTDDYAIDEAFAAGTTTRVGGVAIDRPRDVAVGPDGSVYLLDSGNRRVLRASGPDAREWLVHHQGSDWSEARGLAVADSGDVYVADTGNHRIVRIGADGHETSHGRFGRDRGAFRYPNDVAIAPDGRIYVADTHNHRIALFDAAFNYDRSLGQAPLLRNPETLALGPGDMVFIADVERTEVLAYLGPGSPPQFDGYLRDDVADTGAEPSSAMTAYESPDIVVRRQPDIDIRRAQAEGLEAYGSEPAVSGSESFLYFAANNRGPRPLPPGALRIYTSAVDAAAPLHDFPAQWRTSDTSPLAAGSAHPGPGNLVRLPEIGPPDPRPARSVVGPLRWLPGTTTSACDDRLFVMARHVNADDPIVVESSNGLEQALASNDIAVLQVPFVDASCIPGRDRYEGNDEIRSAPPVTERWSHLHARCPLVDARRSGDRYPDAPCEGIFEDGATPRGAEEIWELDISDLSLSAPRDADFLRIALPDLRDPAYRVDDINPARIRETYAGLPGYEPAVMPECGAVQRRDIGPAGLDNTVWVGTTTTFVVDVIPEGPPESTIAPRPVQIAGEQLHAYAREADRLLRDAPLFAGEGLRRRIACPRTLHGLDEIMVSFGEREGAGGSPGARALLSTGGYRIAVRYVSSIERGIPAWAGDPGLAGPIGHLDCHGDRSFSGAGGGASGGLPDSFTGLPFPMCGSAGIDRYGFIERHPALPTPACIADGPGCFSTLLFHWPKTSAPFDIAFAATRELTISVIDADAKSRAEARLSPNMPPGRMPEFGGVDLAAMQPAGVPAAGRIRIEQFPEGYYGLRIEGAPSDLALSFEPVPAPDVGTEANIR